MILPLPTDGCTSLSKITMTMQHAVSCIHANKFCPMTKDIALRFDTHQEPKNMPTPLPSTLLHNEIVFASRCISSRIANSMLRPQVRPSQKKLPIKSMLPDRMLIDQFDI